MKIAIVAAESHAQRTHLLSVARQLGREHDVTVYCRRTSDDAKPILRLSKGVTVEHVDAGPARDLPAGEVAPYLREFGMRLHRRWEDDRPDVVHAHSWTCGLAAVAGIQDLRLPFAQTFVPRHGTDGEKQLSVQRALGRRADAVVARSGEEKATLIRLGVPRNHISVVPYGVDVERFRRRTAEEAQHSRKRLLHVGSLAPDRGAHTALVALSAVPDVELVLAGGPAPEELGSDPQARALLRLAERYGVADRVRLLGRVPHGSVAKLMRGSDIVLTLPRQAPKGTVALEAMACGVPVIASAVGTHLDSVVDEVTGLLVPPDRPAQTARLIRRLLADPTRRIAMGFAGADRARSRYAWERVSQEMLRVYESAAA
ncbi:glycosyltransferase [Thermoactinospora rubra]|uniref:glycosyltransferase n=1 Tax=Thermoactinospora rubra TaxID=1088767 RepID=UPI000A11CE5A|nr:glycosyltransferase [Thermoactinospora rubra]